MSDKFDEFKLIQWIRQFNNSSKIGDDTALLNYCQQGKKLLVTADMLVENTHFLLDKISPYQLGHKTLAVNLSDIAAMGGKPRDIILSCCWSDNYTLDQIKDFFRGLYQLSSKYGVELAGGDTCRGEIIALDLCLLGEVEAGKEVTRKGAKEGDHLIITGPVGTSAAGMELVLGKELTTLTSKEKNELLEAHLTPEPKVVEGYELGKNELANSMIDISDGLSNEIHHLAYNSQVGAEIYESKITFLDSVKKAAEELNKDPLDWAFEGGEDYQLLISVEEKNLDKALEVLEKSSSPQVIGRITSREKGIRLYKDGNSYDIHRGGYSHF